MRNVAEALDSYISEFEAEQVDEKASGGATAGDPVDILADATPATLPVLPANCLPEVIDKFAHDEADRLGVTPGVVALGALAVAAAAASDALQLQPKEYDTRWRESPRLWVAVVDEVGTKKTALQRAVTRALVEVERHWFEEDAPALTAYEVQAEVFKKAQRLAVKERAAGRAAVIPEAPERPPARRKVVDDTTPEALSVILADNPAGVLCLKDELASWFASFDCYRSKGAGRDRALWLELYNGGGKVVDRLSRGRVFVPNWSACLLGCIQPGPMRRLAGKITDDGLIQRFIVVRGKGALYEADREPNRAAADAYYNVISRLASVDGGGLFQLSAGAHAERKLVNEAIQRLLVLPHVPEAARGHFAKWSGLFARLVLTYHLIEAAADDREPEPMIPADTASKVARLLLDYLLAHSLWFYRELCGEESSHARWIAGYVLAHGLKVLTARDIARGYRDLRHSDHMTIARAVEPLELCSWVTRTENHGTPTRWQVNPRVHSVFRQRAKVERKRREEVKQKIREAAAALKLPVDNVDTF